MKTINKEPLIVDYSEQDLDYFIDQHISALLDKPGDLSSGINGCIRAGAYDRVCSILAAHGAPEPKIVKTINDQECELTYVVENGE